VFLAFQFGVMYVLSFAIIITAFASATAVAVLHLAAVSQSLKALFQGKASVN
jgi:hypothetical protein